MGEVRRLRRILPEPEEPEPKPKDRVEPTQPSSTITIHCAPPRFGPPSPGLGYRDWKTRLDSQFEDAKQHAKKTIKGGKGSQGTNWLMRRAIARFDKLFNRDGTPKST